MHKLIYVKGDATILPLNDQTTTHFLLHIVNCQGYMNAGIAKTIRIKFPVAFDYYTNIINSKKRVRGSDYKSSMMLGIAQLVPLEGRVEESNSFIVNLFAQDYTGPRNDGRSPLNYPALVDALRDLKIKIENNPHFEDKAITIHMPQIGAGLAGGHWPTIESIILDILGDYDIICYIFD